MAALAASAGLRAEGPIDLPPRGDRWVEVRTANFTLFGNASESKTKDVGLEMEKLHAVLRALKRGSGLSSPIPTFLYVFKNHPAMEPYLPRAETDVISYFYGGNDGNYVALTAAWNSDPRRTVYHNYIYYLMNSNFPPQPLWYEVGMAAYYSTFRAADNEVQTGMIREDLLAQLRGTMMMIPLDRLFAADRKSPEYNDELKRSIFFAESWALVHYLTLGNTDRTPQLGRFLTLLQQGRAQDEAFREAFQTDSATLFGELVAYVRNKRFLYNRFKFSELTFSTEARTAPMRYASVLCRLGELLAHGDKRLPDAERYFEAALASEPADPDALDGLGMVRMRQERFAEAAAFFGKAVASDRADYRAYYDFARLKLQELAKAWSWPMTDDERAGIEAGRAALRKSIALNPDFPEARVELGRSFFVEQPDGLDEGIAELALAAKALASRPDVARDLASLSTRKKQHDEAARAAPSATPGPAASTGSPTPTTRGKAVKSQDALADVNALLAQGKDDEAVAMLEGLAAKATNGYRDALEDELRRLKAGVARNKAMRGYNAAIALYNRHEYPAALQAFEKVAATSPQTEAGRWAAAKAAELRALLKK